MAEHTMATGEPVAIAHLVTVLTGAAAGALGIALNDTTVSVISAVAWVLISTVASLVARGRVTPLAGGWQAQVKGIVEEVVQDVVSQQLNPLTPALAPSGQPSYVPPAQAMTPPPAQSSSPPPATARPAVWATPPVVGTARPSAAQAEAESRSRSGDTATFPTRRP